MGVPCIVETRQEELVLIIVLCLPCPECLDQATVSNVLT